MWSVALHEFLLESGMDNHELYDDLMYLTNPDNFRSKEETHKRVESIFGYDLIDYHEMKYVCDKLGYIIENTQPEISSVVKANMVEIIRQCIAYLHDVSPNVMSAIMTRVIKAITGHEIVLLSNGEPLEDQLDDAILGEIGSIYDDCDDYLYEEPEDEDEDEIDIQDEMYKNLTEYDRMA